jgi:hypothetical protein
MTPQEQQSLEQFLKQLAQAPAVAKDSQADAMIQAAVMQRPDAAYLLVQRAMLLEQALEQCKAQLNQWQAQANNSSFMPRHNPWLAGTTAPAAAAAPMPMAAPAPSSGVSSFLGNVATTAAGVVAGSFLFQGLEHLLHPQHSGGWLGGDEFAGRAPAITENTVVNNYYGDSGNKAQSDWPDAVDTAAYEPDPADMDSDDDSTWI